MEAKMYKYLGSSGTATGIPKVYALATEGQYNIMLMDLLGKSLEDLFVECGKKLSLKTVLQIGEQLIDRIEFLHERHIIHRDIKPDNFLMGTGKNAHIVYVIDFGLSKKYISEGKHIPYKEGKELTGTARYASINTHMGIEQSRRDDIESIGYVMLYLLRGILPWQNMKAKDTKTKYKMIMDKKIATPADMLCQGFPSELAVFINYAKGLKFEEKPDYAMIRTLFEKARKSNGIEKDYVYDWSNWHKKGVEREKLPQSIPKAPEMMMQPNSKGEAVGIKGEGGKGYHMLATTTSNIQKGASKPTTTKLMEELKGTVKPQNHEFIPPQKIPGPKISVIKK